MATSGHGGANCEPACAKALRGRHRPPWRQQPADARRRHVLHVVVEAQRIGDAARLHVHAGRARREDPALRPASGRCGAPPGVVGAMALAVTSGALALIVARGLSIRSLRRNWPGKSTNRAQGLGASKVCIWCRRAGGYKVRPCHPRSHSRRKSAMSRNAPGLRRLAHPQGTAGGRQHDQRRSRSRASAYRRRPALRRVRALEQAGSLPATRSLLDETALGFSSPPSHMVGLHNQAEAELAGLREPGARLADRAGSLHAVGRERLTC